MATAKEQLIQLVQDLPDDLSSVELERELIQNIQYARHIRSLAERAEQDIEERRTISHDDLKKKRGFG
jgi:hypothetical protein